jgi:SHS2 domain-containing protein
MTRCGPSADREAGWEHFPHDADVGLRALARYRRGLLSRPRGLTAVVTHAEVEPNLAVEVRCKAPDLELLRDRRAEGGRQ